MDEIIKVENITKIFKVSKQKKGRLNWLRNLIQPEYENKIAVNKISFSINQGEAVAFIGTNGAGKSTTIKMLSGILHPTSGNIVVDGLIPYKQRRKYVSNIGVVLGQKSQLVWDLPVKDSFELIKKIYSIPNDTYENNLKMFMELLELEGFINQPVRQLSLGQKMRAEIVAAMLHSPKIIFLDEPTIGLDVVAKQKIQTFIRKINIEFGVTVIFTTHDMQDIIETCNRLVVIDKGSIIYDGSIEDIKKLYGEEKILSVEFDEEYEFKTSLLMPVEKIKKNEFSFTILNKQLQMEMLKKDLLDRYHVEKIVDNTHNMESFSYYIKLKELVELTDTYCYKVEKLSDYEFILNIKDINQQLGELINNFMTNYNVKDFSIKDPSLTEIVCRIYEGRIRG